VLDLVKQLADGPPERGLDGHARGLPAVHGRAVVQLREHTAELLRRAAPFNETYADHSHKVVVPVFESQVAPSRNWPCGPRRAGLKHVCQCVRVR
jgi:hypothetical protein